MTEDFKDTIETLGVDHVAHTDQIDVVGGHTHGEIALGDPQHEVFTVDALDGADFYGLDQGGPVVRVYDGVADVEGHVVSPLSRTLRISRDEGPSSRDEEVTSPRTASREAPHWTRYSPPVTFTPRARLALVALSVPVLALSLTGCFNGPQATTNAQATQPSGDGVWGQIGTMKVNNATLVLGPAGSKTATLIMTISNVGTAEDSLDSATIAGASATILPAANIPVAPNSSASFGYVGAANSVNVAQFETGESTYVPVTLTFKNSGILTLSVLTVSADGIYTGITPGPVG